MRTTFHIMKRIFVQKMVGKREVRVYYSCNTIITSCVEHPLSVSKMYAENIGCSPEQNSDENPKYEIGIHLFGLTQ